MPKTAVFAATASEEWNWSPARDFVRAVVTLASRSFKRRGRRMSFSSKVPANATVDANQETRDGGVGAESEGGKRDGEFPIHRSPSEESLRRWRQATLVLDAGRRYVETLDLKEKGTVAKVSMSVFRSKVHVVVAVHRFKEAARRDPQPGADQHSKENQCTGMLRKCVQDLARSIFYGRPYQTGYTNSDTGCVICFVCVVLTVFVISLHSQIVPWPVKTHSYTTAYLPENTGVIVACESYLESGAKNLGTKASRNLCFQAKKLETVTVVMFSDPLAKALMDEKIEEEDLPKSSITKTLEGGLSVTQEAYDHIELVHSTVHPPLTPLFPGGYNKGDFRKLDYVLNLMNFPEDYLLVSWIYDCDDCISCSLEVVKNLSWTVDSSNEASWVYCFYYERRANKCRTENRYTGKCKLYPPEKLSPTFAIRKFLKEFSKLTGVRNIRASKSAHRRTVKLEPNVLYLNISHASSSSIMLGFMEVERGSPAWTMLLSLFPTVKKDCTKLPRVLVCNGTSVCNMFRNADSYELRCLGFKNHSQCKLLFQHSLYIPDYKVQQTGEILCPIASNCKEEAPYFVVWKTPERMENDALNSFLGSRKLYKEWAKRSGVCTNTYENVIRYYHPHTTADGSAGTSAKESNMTMFFESNCTKETSTQPSYCVPTGRYHTLSDNPGADWKYLRDDLSLAVATRVEWQRDEPMDFGTWFIGAFGNVSSWIGSVSLVFFCLFGIFASLRSIFAPIPKDKLKRG